MIDFYGHFGHIDVAQNIFQSIDCVNAVCMGSFMKAYIDNNENDICDMLAIKAYINLNRLDYARKALIVNTFLFIFDIFIVLPLALPTFILRGRFVLNSFKSQSYKFVEEQGVPYNFQPGQAIPNKTISKRSYNILKVLDYDIELRVFLMINFLISIFDLFIIILTIPSILMPTRTVAYFAILYKYYWRDQGGHLNQMRKLLFLNLFCAAFDLLNIFSLIYNIILSTRYIESIQCCWS